MGTVRISPEIIEWAASRTGLPLDEFASSISKRNPDKIKVGTLTEPQALRIAKQARIKLGDLFLNEPPAPAKLPITDFRTLQESDPLSDDFFETLRDIEFKQDWYKNYLIQEGADPLPFVGKYAGAHAAPRDVAIDIKRTLGIDDAFVRAANSPEQLYSKWVDLAESAGILIFKNGIVGNNTRRKLSVREFRGFVISDRLAPAIFINGNDSPAAWLFTLAHELAHIWLGESGVSDTSPGSHNPTEVLCNQIAAEQLVPKDEFNSFWSDNSALELGQVLRLGRLRFKVSELVIARRALDSRFISKDQYKEVDLISRNKYKTKNSDGGDFYLTHKVRNSKKLTKRVSELAVAGKISFREAGHVLHIAPSRVMTVYKKNRALST